MPDESKVPNVLIVDDNKHFTAAVSALLSASGYTPAAFYTASEALAHVGRWVPDAALVDIHLPDMNGLALSRELRGRFGPRLPIIVLSADTTVETLDSLRDAGATYFFSKVVNSTLLLERLGQLLAEQGSGAEPPKPQGPGGALHS